MTHRSESVIMTIDPTAPQLTVIGYNASFDRPDYIPIGYGGAEVLNALLRAGFRVMRVVGGDSYLTLFLYNTFYSNREMLILTAEYNNLGEPVT